MKLEMEKKERQDLEEQICSLQVPSYVACRISSQFRGSTAVLLRNLLDPRFESWKKDSLQKLINLAWNRN